MDRHCGREGRMVQGEERCGGLNVSKQTAVVSCRGHTHTQHTHAHRRTHTRTHMHTHKHMHTHAHTCTHIDTVIVHEAKHKIKQHKTKLLCCSVVLPVLLNHTRLSNTRLSNAGNTTDEKRPVKTDSARAKDRARGRASSRMYIYNNDVGKKFME